LEQTRILSYRPFSLKLGGEVLQELAVRYSFNKKNLYLNVGDVNCCMTLELKEHNKAITDYIRYDAFNSNILSIELTFYLPLGLLLLFFIFLIVFKKNICT